MWPRVQFDYSDATVLLTGGTHGIGYGIAHAYREAGAAVTITGTRQALGEYDGDFTGMRYLPLQLTDNASIERVAAALPALDILVNNAGANLIGRRDEYDPDGFEEAVRINLTGAYRMAAACKPKLAASAFPGGASVIGIASMTSFFGHEMVPGYGAGKAGLVQLTMTLGIAWARDRIRVNAVAAGIVRSQMTALMIDEPSLINPYLARMAIKRVGEPADIAAGVLFLTSPAASYITGQTLRVDGGFSIVG
jgi:3-oxoacyl-[acyl-carrier protein] reductase